jgi:probable F420-dependent oxidoreductase
MREYVTSLRAIWHTFQTGEPLAFEGRHYRFTRMQPFFNPGPIEHPEIPILLGAVGPKMTALVGEVSDGLLTHPTNSASRYLREVTRPAIETGAKRVGRGASGLALLAGGFIATGSDDVAVARQREHVRELLTFLYSTPAYWPSLDLFGWREVGERLHRLTREGKWGEMAGAVTDEMLDILVPSGTYAEIADRVRDAYAGLASGVTFPVPEDPADDAEAARAIAALRET